jgi:signal peptide peptidase SppA
MAGQLAFLAQRVFNRPLIIAPEKAEVIVAALAERLGVAFLTRFEGEAVALGDFDAGEPARERCYELIAGTAIVPIQGTLVQKLGSLRPYSGMTGYDGTRALFLQALHDPEVDAIVLDIDSPGGEVAGCFDLVDTIFAARGTKPVHAILNETAYSAAYAIASAADRVTVPRTGGTGSIGAICMHVDMSRAIGTAGLKVSMIRFGERKAEGNQYEPLTDAARSGIQADIDAVGELFLATVARNRGLDAAKLRALQAVTLQGEAGVAAGLADAVAAPDEAFAELLASLP